MAPSKMGFRPGSEVTLHNALVMLMVKSANDIAVAIAEGVSGSVEAFADDMNRASAALGMTQSQWANPNGLPDTRQVTSARDLAILGRALYLQFPEHANLFNIGAMQLGKQIIPTHNGLLGRYPGADGMKTGFTCPAGFNLVASATHGGRRLIAVILGAPNPVARTAKAAALLDRGFHASSAVASLASLPSSGPTAAPDMRDSVCHHRGAATAQFMAEVEDMAIPVGSAATGIPLLDTLGGAQQQINVKDLARLPRPHFTPVAVYVGRAPGYAGPVARARAPGAPVGEQPDLAAYANDNAEAPGADASPISRAAPDATSLRKVGKRGGKRALARGARERTESIVQETAAEGKAKRQGATGGAKGAKAAATSATDAKDKAAPQDAAAKAAANKASKPKTAAPQSAAPKAQAAPSAGAANKQGKT